MLFNSFEFILIFLPIALLVSLKLKGNALLRWICVVSVVFYSLAGHVWFIIPMAITTIVDFFAAHKIENAKSKQAKKVWLLLSMAGNLGLLAYFKYSGFALSTAESLTNHPYPWLSRILSVTLPAGISFYTFQTLSYIIDVYRGQCHAEKNFAKFAGFVTFFPHLVAGPLTRHHQLIPALTRIAEEGIKSRWQAGLLFFAVGLCKKVLLGDNLGRLVDAQLTDFHSLGFLSAWLAIVGYSLQIYFDFSGYSDMAIGLGRLFAVELPMNFNEPYRALNPSDFWNRWHITLSKWLRDYLYISMGGNRHGNARRYFNLMATMVLGGLWHGASWTFAAWGLFHGLLLVLYHGTQKYWDDANRYLQMAVNFILVCIGWVFFRSDTFSHASVWLSALAGVRYTSQLDAESAKLFLFICTGLFCIHGMRVFRDENAKYSPEIKFALGILTAMSFLLMNSSSKFLYFQF